MLAIDTNILVRLVAIDDAAQVTKSREVIEPGAFISFGVAMEAEWVLAKAYRMSRDDIWTAMTELMATGCLTTPNDADLLWALDRYRAGADFADMLHIASARGTDGFATFDRSLLRDAGATSPVEVVAL